MSVPTDRKVWEGLVRAVGRFTPVTNDLPDNDAVFWEYLQAAGLTAFVSQREVLRFGKPAVAKRLGILSARPPRERWEQTAGLLAAFHTIRVAADAPVAIYNAYRPAAYNRAVGGAPSSDHITNHAIDLRFSSISSFARALPQIRALFEQPELRTSLGIGLSSRPAVHLGIDSPKGHRAWRYVGGKAVAWSTADLVPRGW